MSEAAQAAATSKKHQVWMLDFLKQAGGSCSYEAIVERGEEEQCDTVGAMLKILKRRGVISYGPAFLMFPMHKEETITLEKEDYDPLAA